jgi:DNA polymerase-3 subunit gamma/tau
MADTGRALYHRWRPQTFTDVVGQVHVTRTLQNALAGGRVAHAYLFTGPRGTGKTSVARILAKAVNCLAESGPKPCNQCSACHSITEGRALDLIEIDAASNTSVDDVRDLRDKVNFRPNELKYRVYIIDEVHMLSTAAFNALLKTLEEPPPHVIFVLATTEVHKVPATILSRCQRFDFRRLTLAELTGKLRRICDAENIAIEPPALELIARTATGSFRDAESILDQLAAFSGDQVTLDQVQAMLGTAGGQAVVDLVDCLLRRDTAAGLLLINRVIDEGVDPRQFVRQLLDHLRGLLLVQTGGEKLLNTTQDLVAQIDAQASQISTQQLLSVIKLFTGAANQMKAGLQPQLPLELALVEAILLDEAGAPSSRRGEPSAVAPERKAEEKAPPSSHLPAGGMKEEAVAERPALAPIQPARQAKAVAESKAGPPMAGAPSPVVAGKVVPPAGATLDTLIDQWGDFLAQVRALNKSAEAVLKDSRPVSVDGRTVTLGLRYPVHLELVEDRQRKSAIIQALSTLLGQPCELRTTLIDKDDQQLQRERPKNKYDLAAEDPVVKAAMKMGGRIVDVTDEPSDV